MNDVIPDVLIVGGGLSGLGTADALARRGVKVAVLDRERVASRASWAGVGMLNCRPKPRSKRGGPDYTDLVLASVSRYPAWSARLREETGIDIGYVRCGSLELFTQQRLAADGEREMNEMLAGAAARAVRATKLSPQEVKALEPALALDGLAAAVDLPGDAQVRTPWLGRALAAACQKRGVELKENVAVADVLVENGKVTGVIALDGTHYKAGKVVIAAGAWSGQFRALVDAVPRAAKINPVRGQIVCYQLPKPVSSRFVTTGELYLVPRPDGVVLVGSTSEKAGFAAATTPEALQMLRDFGAGILPMLKGLEPLRCWADLRPHLSGKHPLLGPAPGVEGLYLAAGHYRNGIVLAPITAEIMAAVILGEQPPVPISHYLPKAA